MQPFFRNILSRIIILAAAPVLFFHSECMAQSGAGGRAQYYEEAEEKYRKQGWSIGPLPAVSYDSDLGFQIGVLFDMHYFGDGGTYPDYLHRIMAEACYFTKGSGIYHLFYDSKFLIKGKRVTASVSYLPNTMMAFRGFNGYASPFIPAKSAGFYAVERNLLRSIFDIQGGFARNTGWIAGISFFHYVTGPVRVERYRGQESLYSLYVDNGIIYDSEKNGGSHIEFKTGAYFDTRNHEPDPARGIYTYAILYASPDVISRRGNGYIKLGAAFSHFVPIVYKRLTLAYRLNYQGTVAGNVPFYVQQNYTSLYLRQINSDILGGGLSVRGILYNRAVGDAMAWANIEARLRLLGFFLYGQKWYVTTNPFFDMGMVTKLFRLEEMRAAAAAGVYGHEYIYAGDKESLHMTIGIGLKLVMNDNFVLSAEYGKALDGRDGNHGLYLNLNYIF